MSDAFPPSGPTSLRNTIPSYLYQEYADDDDLQALVSAYNQIAQQIINWFNQVNLPVYTGVLIAGPLLDWVAQGLYGIVRPSLSSGRNRNLGAYNTVVYNLLAYNKVKVVGPSDVTVTTDDIFKRIITWNFYRGDGNVFNIRWLKRRVVRFLNGTNGTAPNVDTTYQVSVTMGQGIVSIRLAFGSRTINSGSIYNRGAYNTYAYNTIKTTFNSGPSPPPYASVLQEALESGVLLFPFQFQPIVTV